MSAPDHPHGSRADVPDRIGKFEVLRPIGEGGMATVFEAEDRALGRRVALKLVRSDRRDDSYEQERLIREARAIAEISHPNVITVYEVGRCPEGVFIAMEYVKGPTLKQWLRASPRPWGEVVRMSLRVGRGLVAAHDRGITHGDFKPANVIIGEDERPRVLDFGLAHVAKARRDATSPQHAASSTTTAAPRPDLDESISQTVSLDRDGDSDFVMFAGTPAYMAPEQHKGEHPGPLADQFSFSIVMWEALYRQRPFLGKNPFLVSQAIIDDKVTPPPRSRVPLWIHRIVERGISNAPSDRHISMRSMLASIVFTSRVMQGY